MYELAVPSSKASVYLRLGRVSNLPTVWTNVIAAIVLSGERLDASSVLPLLLAISCFYIGGMFLNDAFDREFDLRARPDRPIPAGLISPREVFAVGFLLLFLGWAIVTLRGGTEHLHGAQAALALFVAIVLYDASHRHALAPFIMGACRGLVYLTVALTVVNGVRSPLLVGALLITVYVAALSFVAKRSPGSHRVVATLIAGIALLDALLVLSQGHPAIAALTALGFPLTVLSQRWIRGT